ncbi:hypothetical protein EPTV-WA-145 [Eptesipox virus]|uniref:Uncharacterized protein n=1 Tax=Eptesipox virus TaxID=1329402 RepID=A0A220T6L1_9POXV|nr:hypothetical protein CG743_gp145 [Eptesipox virus]ASK51346.1 hypothetical protein EPTV-WA-145 [Eptesipox virus]
MDMFFKKFINCFFKKKNYMDMFFKKFINCFFKKKNYMDMFFKKFINCFFKKITWTCFLKSLLIVFLKKLHGHVF